MGSQARPYRGGAGVTVVSRHSSGVPPGAMLALMFAVFTVSAGYGVVLPLLPYRVEQLIGLGPRAVQVSRNVGLLAGIYTLGVFLFAPTWGRISDRRGRRRVLLVGLVGFSATMLMFSSAEALWAVYAERFLSGVFAAAVTPVASAAIGDLAVNDEARARRLTFVSLSGVAGFLLGPMLGVFIARSSSALVSVYESAGSLVLPLAATAVLALAAAFAVGLAVPATPHGGSTTRRVARSSLEVPPWVLPNLLTLTFIVSGAIGVFEVGLALRGKLELGLSPYQIAVMFSECSLAMFVAQAIVFSPLVKPVATRWLVAPAFAMLSVGLFLVPRASEFTSILTLVGTIAVSAGVLSPILTFWISSIARDAQGAELGKQTAAASLGATAGSGMGGLLFNWASLPGGSFVLTAALAMIGFILSLRFPKVLNARANGIAVLDSDTG